METPALNVVIVALDPLVRMGLAAALGSELEIVGQTATLAEADPFEPDVILWDFDVGEKVDEVDEEVEGLSVPIVALIQEVEVNVTDALNAGTTGVLYRNAEADKIVAALQAAVQGLVVLEPAFTSSLQEIVPDIEVEPLTAREQEVLQLLAQGASNKTVAKELDISESTAKFHTSAILGKLGAKSRTEAVVRAAQLGLILL